MSWFIGAEPQLDPPEDQEACPTCGSCERCDCYEKTEPEDSPEYDEEFQRSEERPESQQ